MLRRIVCFVLFYVLFVCKCVLPPGDNPIAVNKYIISNCVVLSTFVGWHIACHSMHSITEKACVCCFSTWLTVNFRNVSVCDLVQLQHRRSVHRLGAATMQHWWSDWCGEGIHHQSGWWTLPHRIVGCECALVMIYNVISSIHPVGLQ